MNEYNNDSQNAFIEDLTWQVLVKTFLRNIFSGKFEQITDKLIVGIPALIFFQKVWHKVPIADKFHQGKAEVWIAARVDLMELSSQNKVERDHFLSVKVILLSSSITDQVEEKLKERSLMIVFAFLTEDSVEDIHYSLNSMFQEDIRVIAGNKFITNDDELRIVFNVSGIDCTVIWTD